MQSTVIGGRMDFKRALPKRRADLLNPLGWGYNDSRFKYTGDHWVFTGNRYPIGSGVKFTAMKGYLMEHYGLRVEDFTPPTKVKSCEENYAAKIENPKFLEAIKSAKIEFSDEFEERLFRAHGQSAVEIFLLNFGGYERIPDLVLFPKNNREVEDIVKIANELNVALIPVGGNTGVTESSVCPGGEKRQIAVVDCSQMNKMLWIDHENHVACFEAGIVGQDLEKILNMNGYTMGHEPDSIEFSTLGGWVATRASGMKRQKYGNIEDIVANFKLVTSVGTMTKQFSAPRVSMGPNFDALIIGSEGIFGIVTEVVIKIHRSPEVKRYGSIVFHDFDSGVDCMREIAKSSCQPASLRLVDNFHFESSSMLRQAEGKVVEMIEAVKRGYISKVKRYDLKKVAIATFLFEGQKEDVERDERILLDIASDHGGYSAGESYGKMGYQMTFYIAYIRDTLIDLGVCAESYETSISWSKCKPLFESVTDFWNAEMSKLNVRMHQIGYRISQIYHDGVCCYFYFGYKPDELTPETFKKFKEIRGKFLDVIHSAGGSLSHHHGVGKKLSSRYEKMMSPVEIKMLKAIKREIDPKNIFAVSNLLSEFSEMPIAKL